jgi:hypothetical protein
MFLRDIADISKKFTYHNFLISVVTAVYVPSLRGSFFFVLFLFVFLFFTLCAQLPRCSATLDTGLSRFPTWRSGLKATWLGLHVDPKRLTLRGAIPTMVVATALLRKWS